MKNQGQAWSMDLIIGVLIFLLVIGVFYVLLRSKISSDTTELKVSAEMIAMKMVADPDVSIVKGDKIDKEKVDKLMLMNYDDLKKEIGVKNDFCIFMEDSAGNLVPIKTGSGSYNGIGPGRDLDISGTPCGELIGG